MASNSFGNVFRITTWGESHGKAVGVVIDGCPAGIVISEEEINEELKRRAPGRNPYTSSRKEPDKAEILSGLFEGETTGAPLSIIIWNKDADPSKYEPIKGLLRPGHANYPYLHKYGRFDYRGGGRSSARETACRVAAGAIAKKVLATFGVAVVAYLKEVADVRASIDLLEGLWDATTLKQKVSSSSIFCPDDEAMQKMMKRIEEAKAEGDSVGGIAEVIAFNVPIGLGDPIYEKIEANLAKAMLSLPATKGVEVGEGFTAAKMKGSEHNDAYTTHEGRPKLSTNHSGGTLGGISTGEPILARVVFKPTSSIKKTQQTVDLEGNPKPFVLPLGSRHDPCVAIRGVPIVEAMAALVLVDALLLNRCAKL